MGNSFSGMQNHELAYIYAYDAQNVPILWIIDMTTVTLVAWNQPAAGYTLGVSYFNYITDPSGNKYPFIAPGGHYLSSNFNVPNNAPQWDYMCIFDPAYVANAPSSCNSGFKPYTATFTTSSGETAANVSQFRHGGGWVSDVNGDGWGDINLPFLRYVLTISGKTGQQLGLSFIVPGSVWVPPLPVDFDWGRLYGAFTEMKNKNGQQSVLISATDMVGNFANIYCNVSCYFLLANWNGSSWTPEWDTYLSYERVYDEYPTYLKNFTLNGCTHRYDSALEYIGGHPYAVFDYFTEDLPAPMCKWDMQAGVYVSPCDTNVILQQATGIWSMSFIDAWTGTVAKVNMGIYAWGRATNVIPSHPYLILVQNFTSNNGKVAFGYTASAIDQYSLVELTSEPGISVVSTILTPPAKPTIDSPHYYGADGPGLGQSNAGFPELHLKDIDSDGLNDIGLSNGQWLGWSSSQGKLIIKNAT